MAREATGGAYFSKGRWYARVSLGKREGKKLRPNFALPPTFTDALVVQIINEQEE